MCGFTISGCSRAYGVPDFSKAHRSHWQSDSILLGHEKLTYAKKGEQPQFLLPFLSNPTCLSYGKGQCEDATPNTNERR